MSVRRAQQEIDAREFAEWIVYYDLEPWGDAWRRSAMLAMLLCRKTSKLEDWMPKARWKVQPEQDQEDVMMATDHFFRMLAKSRGGKRKPAK